jgi:DNA (cytosine-5)-methyltransferase 1
MSAIYNEIEPYAAQWTRNLIAAGHVAPGVVDERSITDLAPTDVAGTGQRHFFAGIAVWSYALRLAGIPDELSVWTGSCPCQPFSSAGKRAGFDDARHLWPAWFRLIRECRPAIVFGEQVASPDGRAWLDVVSSDLEGAGYSFGAANLCAGGVGAPHIRQRLYFVAYAGGDERRSRRPGEADEWSIESSGRRKASQLGDADGIAGRRDGRAIPGSQGAHESVRSFDHGPGDPSEDVAAWDDAEWVACLDGKSRPAQPGAFPLAHGAVNRLGRLRAYGNAIVPQVAATFIRAALSSLETQ